MKIQSKTIENFLTDPRLFTIKLLTFFNVFDVFDDNDIGHIQRTFYHFFIKLKLIRLEGI